MKRQLHELKQKVRTLNEIGMTIPVSDRKIYFPNSQFGDNCADNITKGKIVSKVKDTFICVLLQQQMYLTKMSESVLVEILLVVFGRVIGHWCCHVGKNDCHV